MNKQVPRIERQTHAGPSRALLRAAASGLLGLSFAACEDKEPSQEKDPETDEHRAELCEPKAGSVATSGKGAGAGGATGSAGKGGAGEPSAAAAEEDKEISRELKQYTNSELIKMCDERGGYIQNHGSCSGSNTCRGFSYGDWDEDAELVEHSCSGVNGCAGLSCVTAEKEPAGGGKTGEEIMKLDDNWYEERAGQYGPKPCRNCHIESMFDDDKQDYVYDYTKLKLPVWASSGRNAKNWLDRKPEYQEAMIAFGVQGIQEDGTAYSNMAPYAKLFSKAEIKRVVEYMRKFDPARITFKEIKLKPGKAE